MHQKTDVTFRIIWAVVYCTGLLLLPASLRAAAAPEENGREHVLIDADWLFHSGDVSAVTQATALNYDETQWERIHLPHDYVLEGTYSKTESRDHGYLPVQVGWYRKHLFLPASDKGRILRLDFDGVFRDSQVWLNGQLLGRHQGGYTPFSYDITKVAKLGGDNVVAVRVDPRKFEGWWYEGGGIYRHVYLTILSPLHVARFGTYVVSTVPHGNEGADANADLSIQTTLENNSAADASAEIISEIVNPAGETLKTLKTSAVAPSGAHPEIMQHTTVNHPQLWSIQSPQLYHLHTMVMQNGRVVDSATTTFGIRTIHFDAEKGFFLNGQHVEIQGAACHQDFPAVGIAVPDSIEPWRVAQLKAFGANGWRTAHNEPNDAVLDACDKLGMLVMDENRHLGDVYTAKTPRGAPTSDLSDLASMIQRDRNHPSVIMWSMCNEEGLQGSVDGQRIFSAMKAVVYKYDRSRPLTSAMNGGGEKIFFNHGLTYVEDIIGINYNYESYDKIHARHPGVPMFGSEDCNEKTTRGQYTNDRAAGMCSAYNLSEKTWTDIATRPYMAGAYIWTGIDYKGEPNPYGWPDVSNNTGLLDSCGFPKDKAYYFQSVWTSKPMVHILPSSWNWAGKEGQNIRVIAFSNAGQVELLLNGRSLGLLDVHRNGHAEWNVPYVPGQLIAVAYGNGEIVASDEQDTTGAPSRIVLTPSRTTLTADGEDAVVIPVSILDDQGRVVPTSDNRVTFHLTGNGQILGVGNGNPADHDPDKATERNAFHGHCIAVLGAGAEPATLQLTATSPGLAPAQITLTVR